VRDRFDLMIRGVVLPGLKIFCPGGEPKLTPGPSSSGDGTSHLLVLQQLDDAGTR